MGLLTYMWKVMNVLSIKKVQAIACSLSGFCGTHLATMGVLLLQAAHGWLTVDQNAHIGF